MCYSRPFSASSSKAEEQVLDSSLQYKIRYTDIYLDVTQLYNIDLFVSILSDKLARNTRYSVLFRVCYSNASNFKMLGRQLGL